MNKQLAVMLLTLMVVACLPITALAQQTDTSSYFPLGMWGIWLDEAQPPYSLSLSTTQWGRERDNWQEIAGNFVMALMKGREEEDSISAFYPNLKYRLDVEDNIYGTNDSHTIWWWIRFSTELGDSWRAGADIRIQDLVNRWSSRQALYSYLVANECPVVTSNCAGVVSQAEYWNRVQYAANKLKALDPNPNHKSIAVSNDAPPQGFTDVTADLDVLQMDCYQFRHSSSYSDQQADIDALLYNYNLTMQRMQGKRTEWQAVIQSQEERRTAGCSYPRRPTFLELRVQAYLALSRGSRGIHYFVYGSYTGAVPGSLVQMPIPTDTCDITGYSGLVDFDGFIRRKWEDVNQPPPGGIMPFANVKALNLELAPLVPVIRKLRVYDAFPNAPQIPSGNIASITNVTGDKIEIGVFKRMDQGIDSTVHFMLVNRVCNKADGSESGPQAVVVQFNHPTYQWLQFSEVVSGKQWLVASNGSFTDTLAPGSGKLYRLEDGLYSLAYQNKSVSSQSTRFNGQRKFYRESSGKLHEVFASGTINNGEIFYRNSTDNGTSWNNTKRLSDGTATSLAPCITVGPGPTVIVAWQQTNGSNYNVVFSRSVNGGSTWSGISTLQSNFSCASPGPLPSVSANINTGSVGFVFRTSSGLRYVYSTTSMASWNGPATVPNTNGNYNSPSTAFYPVSSPMADKCNLAFSTNVGYSSLLYYGYYGFQEGSWSSFTNLSGVLPGSYQQHKNPSLAASSNSTSTIHVAWEATLIAPPTPVLVHRKGSSGNFGSQYTVIQYQSAYNPSITGLTSDNAWMVFQNSSSGGFSKVQYYNSGGSWVWGSPAYVSSGIYAQLSVGSSNAKYLWTAGTSSPYTISIGSETLSKSDALAVDYSRELNFIDTKTGSSITLEMRQPQIVNRDGSISLIPFVDAPPDSVVIATKEILRYGNTQSFAASTETDTLKLQYSVRTTKSANILLGGESSLSFDLCDVNTGKVFKTIDSRVVAKSSDTTNNYYQINIPASNIRSLSQGVSIRPSVVGVAQGSPDMIASLGHIYRLGAEGGSQLPKDVLAEDVAPEKYLLVQNYPNPFNPSTEIRYGLLTGSNVSLDVYDILGRKVAELVRGYQNAGYYSATWNGTDESGVTVSSGVYFARFTVTDELGSVKYVKVNKLLLMK